MPELPEQKAPREMDPQLMASGWLIQSREAVEQVGESLGAQLSVIDNLEADLEAKLKNAQSLRQSILRDAFQGRLVPQDPNGEQLPPTTPRRRKPAS